MEKNYFLLYDNYDNIVCYFNNIKEFCFKFNYPLKEINRKYKNSSTDFINLIIENKGYKLFKFS